LLKLAVTLTVIGWNTGSGLAECEGWAGEEVAEREGETERETEEGDDVEDGLRVEDGVGVLEGEKVRNGVGVWENGVVVVEGEGVIFTMSQLISFLYMALCNKAAVSDVCSVA